MNTTILQIPIDKTLRAEAVALAKEDGFSSLQEVIRVFLSRFVKREVGVTFERYPAVKLSARNEKRYNKMLEDFEKGRNFKTFDSVDDLMKDLMS